MSVGNDSTITSLEQIKNSTTIHVGDDLIDKHNFVIRFFI